MRTDEAILDELFMVISKIEREEANLDIVSVGALGSKMSTVCLQPERLLKGMNNED